MEMWASSGLWMLRDEHACGVKLPPLPATVGIATVRRTAPEVGFISSTLTGSARQVDTWQTGEPATTTIKLSGAMRGKGDCETDGDEDVVGDTLGVGDGATSSSRMPIEAV